MNLNLEGPGVEMRRVFSLGLSKWLLHADIAVDVDDEGIADDLHGVDF